MVSYFKVKITMIFGKSLRLVWFVAINNNNNNQLNRNRTPK